MITTNKWCWLSALLTVSHGSLYYIYPIPVLFCFFLLLSFGTFSVSASLSFPLTVCASICASFIPVGLRFVFACIWSSFFGVPSGSFRFSFLCHKLCDAWLHCCVLFTHSLVLSTVIPHFPFVFCPLPLFRDFIPVCHLFYLLSFLTLRICPVVCLFLLCVLVVRSGVWSAASGSIPLHSSRVLD